MSYNTFARFYDRLTDNVEYEVRSGYISDFFSEYGNGGKALLDLACGTGSFSKIFSDAGYNVTGLDLSADMLTIADNKCGGNAEFVCADMTNFKLKKRFDYCICMLDSLNHLPDIESVSKCVDNVYNSLNTGGLFIFDMNTLYKHRDVLGNNTFVFDEDDFFLSWDNEYNDDDIIRILIDIFVFNGESYDRFSEEFCERAYSIDTIVSILDNFEIIGIYNELSTDEPKDDSERIFFVCKKVK